MAEAPRLRVLIADDEPDTVSTLSAILEGEGHTAYAVYKGSEVLSVLRSRNPDVCILDIGLPGPSGFALAKEIREVYGDKAPLLAMSSDEFQLNVPTEFKMIAPLLTFNAFALDA